jgi:uncharacterized protein VirK/YbjX
MKHQVKLFAVAIKYRRTLQQWYSNDHNPQLARAIERFPLIEGAIYWPYINHVWTVPRRLDVIDQHYLLLTGSAGIISDATVRNIELVQSCEEYKGLRLILEKAPWFLREGEIVLSIFVDEMRIYSIAFTLGIECNQRVVYVGALQGRNIENAMEIYRNITHALYGMRPRDYLLTALKLLSKTMGITTLWGIESEHRQQNGAYFGGAHKNKLFADYNEIWLEHGGVDLKNGFFEISTDIQYKNMNDIPSRKRSNYKRRYAMIDNLEENIRRVCDQHCVQI